MKLSELIVELEKQKEEHGDAEVFIDFETEHSTIRETPYLILSLVDSDNKSYCVICATPK